MSLYYEKVSDEMKSVLIRLMQIDKLKDFRLVGGTSLALQLGHRASIDIDLFAGGGGPTPAIIGQILIETFSSMVSIKRMQRYGLAATINE